MPYTYTLKDKIFSFFGVNAKRQDTYVKFVNESSFDETFDITFLENQIPKGIGERYQESIGADYDEAIGPLIDNFHNNLANVKTCFPEYIDLLEHMVGYPIIIFGTEADRRKMIQFQNNITLIKGTLLSHEVLLGMLGITSVIITIIEDEGGFDSSFTFDDVRRFDTNGIYCKHYTIDLIGSAVHDSVLNAAILRIALYLQPINSVIVSISYNSNPVPLS
jgi:hypothetical protein